MSVERLSKHEMDHLLALGEDLSYLLVGTFLQKEGIDITLIDARHFILTDEHFGKAAPDIPAIKEYLQKITEPLVITQGFIGATKTGSTTTLGRGGGDTIRAYKLRQQPAETPGAKCPGFFFVAFKRFL